MNNGFEPFLAPMQIQFEQALFVPWIDVQFMGALFP